MLENKLICVERFSLLEIGRCSLDCSECCSGLAGLHILYRIRQSLGRFAEGFSADFGRRLSKGRLGFRNLGSPDIAESHYGLPDLFATHLGTHSYRMICALARSCFACP